MKQNVAFLLFGLAFTLFFPNMVSAVSPQIRADHPRLWFTEDDINKIQNKISTTHQNDWNELIQGGGLQANAFRYAVMQDTTAGRNAITSARSLANTIKNEQDDAQVRAFTERMSYVFDWAYSAMTADDKKVIGNGILFGLKWQVDHGYNGPNMTNFSGWHGHGHQVVATIASIALLGENFPLDTNYGYSIQQFYDFSYKNLDEGWWPVFRRIGQGGGGWYMSWMYSGLYLNREVDVLAALTSATGTNYFARENWIRLVPSFFIYSIADVSKMEPLMSDDQGWPAFRAEDYYNQIALSGIFQDGYAKWFVSRMYDADTWLRDTSDSLARVYRILWFDYGLSEKVPTDLPKAKAFSAVGRYIIREGWNPEDLVVYFKNQPFYLWNHSHRDNGQFTINYKRGRLAIDTGLYDSHGSTHYDNYYTRAVAHNTLLIDGNQAEYMWNTQPFTTDVGRTPVFETTDSYTTIVADFANAYAAVDAKAGTIVTPKASELRRHFLYLRNISGWEAPVILIYDRVVSTNANLPKRFLLHSVNTPLVSGLMTTITEGNAKLFVRTFDTSTSAFTITTRGSDADVFDGSHFEDWNYTGWPPTEATTELRKAYYYPGKWRIEVKPKTSQQKDEFVHVLAPASSSVSSPPQSKLIESASVIGAQVNNRIALWGKTKDPVSNVSYEVSDARDYTMLIGGLFPNTSYAISVNGQTILTRMTSANGIVEFPFSQPTPNASYLLRRSVDDPTPTPTTADIKGLLSAYVTSQADFDVYIDGKVNSLDFVVSTR